MLIFFEKKEANNFLKKVWKSLNFMKKWVKKIIVDFVCCHLIKLSHFDININLNLNLNHKCLSEPGENR
jgi:hypothetical protein